MMSSGLLHFPRRADSHPRYLHKTPTSQGWLTRAGLLCLMTNLIHKLTLSWFPGKGVHQTCRKHLKPRIERPPFLPTLWKLQEADLLGQTRLSLAYFLTLRVFASCVSSSRSLCRSRLRVCFLIPVPHPEGHRTLKFQSRVFFAFA